ncbi:MAG: hypothetical protein ABIF85_04905 [Nanoarchaeota archaeon]|nr:hypothetical protein [Nanoarchaeota archaeon]MBU4299904.1 hypothetical protein [Nanoarchaeota archaeon]MBU4452225.1 hypothetical protein [Nanoarchaeota archaeon]MCG2724559.1 hypothetical protein [archaeon]
MEETSEEQNSNKNLEIMNDETNKRDTPYIKILILIIMLIFIGYVIANKFTTPENNIPVIKEANNNESEPLFSKNTTIKKVSDSNKTEFHPIASPTPPAPKNFSMPTN